LVDSADTLILVIAGIPASGKSIFCRKLRERGFYYLTLNAEDDEWRTAELQARAWQRYRAGDTNGLIQALREAPGPVVVEYGFPPDAGNLGIVRALRAAGARFVWFDCPPDVARGRFRKREHGNVLKMVAFDRQMGLITANKEAIAEATGHQTVQVLKPNGKAPRSHDEIYREIFPD
jgi:hypothetical protein